MKIDELLKLPFFQKCVFKNHLNKQEILGRGDEIEDGIAISICKKDGNFEIFTIEHQKKTGRKIVDWEDVR